MGAISIVDNHSMVSEALARLLAKSGRHQVVGRARAVREALSLLETRPADVLLVDLSLQDGNAIDLLRAVRQKRYRTRALVMTGYRDTFYAAEALAAGAAGYILKRQPTADFLAAIDQVAAGRTYLSPAVGEVLPYAGARPETPGDLLDRLTPREREVLHLVVTGATSVEIAERIGVSFKTVDTHRTNINHKLGVRTTASLLRFAVAHGIDIQRPQEPSRTGPTTTRLDGDESALAAR